MLKRRLASVGILILLVGVLVVSTSCSSSGGSGDQSSASPKTNWTIDETSGFNFSPSTIVVPKGKKVSIKLVNKDKVPHNFSVDAFNVGAKSGHDNVQKPGDTQVITFTPDKTGTFTFYCDIPGHRAAGMVGKLEVK